MNKIDMVSPLIASIKMNIQMVISEGRDKGYMRVWEGPHLDWEEQSGGLP